MPALSPAKQLDSSLLTNSSTLHYKIHPSQEVDKTDKCLDLAPDFQEAKAERLSEAPGPVLDLVWALSKQPFITACTMNMGSQMPKSLPHRISVSLLSFRELSGWKPQAWIGRCYIFR